MQVLQAISQSTVAMAPRRRKPLGASGPSGALAGSGRTSARLSHGTSGGRPSHPGVGAAALGGPDARPGADGGAGGGRVGSAVGVEGMAAASLRLAGHSHHALSPLPEDAQAVAEAPQVGGASHTMRTDDFGGADAGSVRLGDGAATAAASPFVAPWQPSAAAEAGEARRASDVAIEVPLAGSEDDERGKHKGAGSSASGASGGSSSESDDFDEDAELDDDLFYQPVKEPEVSETMPWW